MGVAIRDGDIDSEPGKRAIEYARQKKHLKKEIKCLYSIVRNTVHST